jgi:transcriptional regulator with XRE-family HTH domain
MEIYEKIRQRRKELGLSADDVANALNVSRATIFRYESHDIERIPISVLGPLAKVLKCSPSYLIGWEDKDKHGIVYHLSDVEAELLTQYRNSDDDTRNMVKRLLAYSAGLKALKEGDA